MQKKFFSAIPEGGGKHLDVCVWLAFVFYRFTPGYVFRQVQVQALDRYWEHHKEQHAWSEHADGKECLAYARSLQFTR